jgi:hypothetical protein
MTERNMFEEYIKENSKLQEEIKQLCIDLAGFKNQNKIADVFKSCLQNAVDINKTPLEMNKI